MTNQKSPPGTLPMGTIVKTADGVIGVTCGRVSNKRIPLYTRDSSMIAAGVAEASDIEGAVWVPAWVDVEVLYTPYEAALTAFELIYCDEEATNGE